MVSRAPAPWLASRTRNLWLSHVRTRWHEADPLGHINNVNYLHYLEQAAIDHAAAAGLGIERLMEMGGVFIARRHEIDYHRPASAGEVLRVITWPEEMSGARAVRGYRVVRTAATDEPVDRLVPRDMMTEVAGGVLVSARTELAFVDAATSRPRRIPDEIEAAFFTSDR